MSRSAYGAKRRTYKAKLRENAGYLAARRNAVTGAVYVLYDGGLAAMDTTDGRWQTVCETHSVIMSHSSQKMARWHLPTGDWCSECNGARYRGTK